MDRINHVKLTTPNPELVDAFLRQVVDIPEGWPLGANAPVITSDMPLGPGGDLDPMVVNDTRNAGVGLNVTGFISGDTNSRQFQILSGENAQVWAVCIGTRYIERARERCAERGIPATPITVADWNERDNIVNFFCVVGGIMFEVIRVEAKEKS
ncbi:MAG TPA: hypothetical protein VFZ17_02530 [Acidimicrobiia bacterium]|nr:hypothetical protein [Acidimicrobiia bacterium]